MRTLILARGGLGMKIEKILLPFDDSVHSQNAAKFGLDLAKRYSAHVSIIHCYEEWNASVAEIPEKLIMEIRANARREAEALLQRTEELFKNQGIEYSLECVDGEPGHVLANRSKSKQYDLIIMGSHGHSDIAGLFLGSVTHKVLNTIYCPIMVVP